MNLYEVMGLVAVGGGLGASYGMAQQHNFVFWASLVVGAVVGVGVFIGSLRLTVKAPERALPIYYLVTFIGVVAATIASSWAVRASF